MRDCLTVATALTLAAMAAGCVADEAPIQEGNAPMGMEVTLSTASRVAIAQVDPASPAYDFGQAKVDLVFTNRGSSPLTFPGEGITRRVIRTYQNTQTGAQQTFAINEPPVATAELIALAPGESWTYGIGFELPTELLSRDGQSWPVRVCAEWNRAELDSAVFPDGSYQWADSFRACSDVIIQR